MLAYMRYAAAVWRGGVGGTLQIGTDWISGGANLNPAVSLFLYAVGEINRRQFIAKSAAAFAAITCAFPAFDWISNNLSLPLLTGPV
jgi:glycerol uptake facilitator-like aquaporin